MQAIHVNLPLLQRNGAFRRYSFMILSAPGPKLRYVQSVVARSFQCFVNTQSMLKRKLIGHYFHGYCPVGRMFAYLISRTLRIGHAQFKQTELLIPRIGQRQLNPAILGAAFSRIIRSNRERIAIAMSLDKVWLDTLRDHELHHVVCPLL